MDTVKRTVKIGSKNLKKYNTISIQVLCRLDFGVKIHITNFAQISIQVLCRLDIIFADYKNDISTQIAS